MTRQAQHEHADHTALAAKVAALEATVARQDAALRRMVLLLGPDHKRLFGEIQVDAILAALDADPPARPRARSGRGFATIPAEPIAVPLAAAHVSNPATPHGERAERAAASTLPGPLDDKAKATLREDARYLNDIAIAARFYPTRRAMQAVATRLIALAGEAP